MRSATREAGSHPSSAHSNTFYAKSLARALVGYGPGSAQAQGSEDPRKELEGPPRLPNKLESRGRTRLGEYPTREGTLDDAKNSTAHRVRLSPARFGDTPAPLGVESPRGGVGPQPADHPPAPRRASARFDGMRSLEPGASRSASDPGGLEGWKATAVGAERAGVGPVGVEPSLSSPPPTRRTGRHAATRHTVEWLCWQCRMRQRLSASADQRLPRQPRQAGHTHHQDGRQGHGKALRGFETETGRGEAAAAEASKHSRRRSPPSGRPHRIG